MAFLLFLAGFEVDVRTLATREDPPARAALVLAMVAAVALRAVGWQPRAAALVACALIATSVGLVGPQLKDAGLLGTSIGRLTLAGAAPGDVAAIVLISIGFRVSHGPADALAVLGFVVVRRRAELVMAQAEPLLGIAFEGQFLPAVDTLPVAA